MLEEYVASLCRPKTLFTVSGGHVYLNGVPVTDTFSGNEVRVLQVFADAPASVVSRDAVAQAIWGTSWEDRYSDWAIDQTIGRIRKKMLRFDFPKTMIRTVKGKGFVYG